MADSSPLAGLLDRASKVFSLAGKLGRAFHDEHRGQGRHHGQGREINPASWNQHAPDFDEFCAALLDLRDAIENPPVGFGPVAKSLLEAARIAKEIRNAMQRPVGWTWAEYREFFPELNSVSEDGWRAVREVTKARRLDDPFAFVDKPATIPAGEAAAPSRTATCPTCGKPTPIDEHNSLRCPDCGSREGTFGELWIDLYTDGPLSKEDAGDETLCELRHLLRNRFGAFDTAALCKLRDWLVSDHGMTRQQVQVAQRTRLVELLKNESSKQSQPDNLANTMFEGLAAKPNGGNGKQAESASDAPAKRRGRKKADYETVQKEAELAANWERARDAGIHKPNFAKDNRLTVKQLDALLDRVAKRKRASE